ncbi:MAG: hypothetical protein CVV64_08275 [Candidatus Wallbacteria bacterium HGW-Wallbacteria-1]|uniref:Uncharacterized protein n=1 Tax=Candidatus Wallbacteria bacterium HGW-Wallbacteria-1 TaxID=2013854 RepID=A0A2N1PRB4_9BACT|nr:MAG: hypothetical protein CVV64_08275 [Candidatus Wallbacteria bacterium HGW-Wallbacteria-1]
MVSHNDSSVESSQENSEPRTLIQFPASLSFQSLASSTAGQFFRLLGGNGDVATIELIASALFIKIVESAYSYDPMGEVTLSALRCDEGIQICLSHRGLPVCLDDISGHFDGVKIFSVPSDDCSDVVVSSAEKVMNSSQCVFICTE